MLDIHAIHRNEITNEIEGLHVNSFDVKNNSKNDQSKSKLAAVKSTTISAGSIGNDSDNHSVSSMHAPQESKVKIDVQDVRQIDYSKLRVNEVIASHMD